MVRFHGCVSSAGPAEKRLAAPREVAFLMEKGAVMAGRATLVTVMAACKALRHFGAPLATVAAVQGLQGAQPMTPAEHKKLQPGSAALREGAAGPEAAGGTAELHKSTAGATVDEDVTQSSAKQRARADWSCHSSNSEQEEQAPRAALQADEAGVGSQPTQAGLETPRQPDHEACNSAGKVTKPAVATSWKATEKLRMSTVPRLCPILDALRIYTWCNNCL